MIKKTLVFHVKILRLRLGWSHSEMAAHIKCTVEQLKEWEASRIVPRMIYQQYLYNLETVAEENALKTQVIPTVEKMIAERRLNQMSLKSSAVKDLSAALNPEEPQVLRLVADNTKAQSVKKKSGGTLPGGTMGGNSKMNQNESLRGDPIIAAILDELVALTGWDPVAIWPNHRFHTDLEMSENDFAEFSRRLSKRLFSNLKLELGDWQKLTLRDVVGHVRKSMDHKASA